MAQLFLPAQPLIVNSCGAVICVDATAGVEIHISCSGSVSQNMQRTNHGAITWGQTPPQKTAERGSAAAAHQQRLSYRVE